MGDLLGSPLVAFLFLVLFLFVFRTPNRSKKWVTVLVLNYFFCFICLRGVLGIFRVLCAEKDV
jgi:hypothetical protein